MLIGTDTKGEIYAQWWAAFRVKFFKAAVIVIGTIDFDHIVPRSVTLTSTGDYKVDIMQDLLASFSATLFN